MSTIPASFFVNITPGVLSAGGNALDLVGLLLTEDTRVPIGTVASFSTPDAVADYFGPNSQEHDEAVVYFNGFDGSTVKPGAILFAQYNNADVSAFLRGGPVGEALTLAELKALTGTLGLNVDGHVLAASSFSLSAATSFSSAADLIETAINGAISGSLAAFTAAIAATTMTVSAVGSGALAPGQHVLGAGVTSLTIIEEQLTGSDGGIGTYRVSISQTVGSESMTTQTAPVSVTYDSVSEAFIINSGASGEASTISFATGSLAASLQLTLATAAVISQGAAAAVPGSFMDGIVNTTQNWASFMTIFDPDNGSGNDVKFAFAEWTNGKGDRFAYIVEDTDLSPTVTVPASASLGQLLKDAGLSGTCPIFNQVGTAFIAAFVCGSIASLDFARTNGRTTFDYLAQAGLTASVTSETVAQNLIDNGYNYYGAVGAANQGFIFFDEGTISGPFTWLDSYINQIWLNNAFQLALLTLLTTIKSIPYNSAGYALIESALAETINAGLNYGVFRAGVALSSSQISAINNAAGAEVAQTLSERGWYLQVQPASPSVRVARGSPPINFWYVDGESVQRLSLNSVVVQ